MLNEGYMKKTNRTITHICVLAFAAAAVLAAVSCKTAPEAPRGDGPAASEKQEQAAEAYTRAGFAENLKRLLEEKRFEEALASFRNVPEADASSFEFRMMKLSIMISAEKLAEAEELAGALAAEQPANTDVMYARAVIATAAGDMKGRTAHLEAVLKADPNHSQAMTGLALDLLGKKSYKKAKDLLVKAIASDPQNSDALLGLARVYYIQADLEKAGDTLNLALKKAPEDSILWAELARVKSETMDLPGAIDDIEKAIGIDSDIYGHWIDYGTYLISGSKKAEARTAFSRAIELKPAEYLPYIYRAGLNDDLGNEDEALSDYRKVTELYPQYFYAAESLGILLWGRGDYAGARAAFLLALEGNPKNVSYALMATLCSYRQEKEDEAKNFMGKYITTLDRNSTEYFLCRLFVDRAGDSEVLNRIMKEKNLNTRNRMLFYSAMYYDLFQNKSIAQKYFIEIVSLPAPNFFEFRLSQWELKRLESAADTNSSQSVQG